MVTDEQLLLRLEPLIGEDKVPIRVNVIMVEIENSLDPLPRRVHEFDPICVDNSIRASFGC